MCFFSCFERCHVEHPFKNVFVGSFSERKAFAKATWAPVRSGFTWTARRRNSSWAAGERYGELQAIGKINADPHENVLLQFDFNFWSFLLKVMSEIYSIPSPARCRCNLVTRHQVLDTTRCNQFLLLQGPSIGCSLSCHRNCPQESSPCSSGSLRPTARNGSNWMIWEVLTDTN